MSGYGCRVRGPPRWDRGGLTKIISPRCVIASVATRQYFRPRGSMATMSARDLVEDDRRTERGASVLRLSGDAVAPKRFDIVWMQHVVPRRHVAFSVGHGIDKSCVGVGREVPQIDRPLRIAHTCAVAGRTVVRE